jgi:hypothetical protein
VPDLHHVQGNQQRQGAVQRCPDQVAGDHHRLPRQPVRNHATDQQEQDEGQDIRGKHDTDVARVAGQPGDEQPDRDNQQAVADHARRLTEPEQAKIA